MKFPYERRSTRLGLIGLRIFPALLTYQVVASAAEPVNFSSQEFVCRPGGNPRPLKVTDFLPLPQNLAAHKLDVTPDGV